MNMRVLVVDDEPLARCGIIKRLAAYVDIEVIGEAADGESALECMLATHVDLVFMDVQMPGINGLEALRLLPQERRPLTVFLTAYDRFALHAFEVHALDYLLKPIDDERFAEALDRARESLAARRINEQQQQLDGLLCADAHSPYAMRFAIRSGHRVALVAATDVDWIEAMGDYVGLHVGDKLHLLREPLHRLSRRLDPLKFTRIHRSTIVRIECIAEMRTLSNRDSLLRLHDGTPLRVSRTYADALSEGLAGSPNTSIREN